MITAHEFSHIVQIALGISNVVFSLFIVYFSGNCCKKAWLKRIDCSLFTLIGLFWASVYIVNTLRAFGFALAFLPPTGSGPDTFGGLVVRPGFTFTLAVMATASLRRFRRRQIEPDGLEHTR